MINELVCSKQPFGVIFFLGMKNFLFHRKLRLYSTFLDMYCNLCRIELPYFFLNGYERHDKIAIYRYSSLDRAIVGPCIITAISHLDDPTKFVALLAFQTFKCRAGISDKTRMEKRYRYCNFGRNPFLKHILIFW